MGVLSKYSEKYVLHGFTCYEVGHTWSASCLQAWKDVGFSSYKTAFKIYLPLYLLALFLRRRNQQRKSKLMQDILKMLPELLRSTFFLGTNGLSFIVAFCLWRKCFPFYFFFQVFTCGTPCSALALALERPDRRIVTGTFTLANGGFLPALANSAFSISFERKQRRSLLAVYMANIAVETLYLMLKTRKLIRPLPYGEVVLFSLSTSFFLYMYRTDRIAGSLKSGIRFILGDSHNGAATPTTSSLEASDSRSLSPPPPPSVASSRQSSAASLAAYLPKWAQAALHSLAACGPPPTQGCRHGRVTCLANAVGKFARLFALGYGLQSVLRLLAALAPLLRKLRAGSGRQGGPRLSQLLWHPDSLWFGVFLGGLSGLHHAVGCLLRRLQKGSDRPWQWAVSGLSAGTSLLAYRSSSLAMYTASKAAELACSLATGAGWLPRLPHSDILLYAISTAVVFHCAVFEPHSLRPAYWRFLLRMTDGRFAFINRRILDLLNGGHSSALYPEFWPNYDPAVTDLWKGPERVVERLAQAAKTGGRCC